MPSKTSKKSTKSKKRDFAIANIAETFQCDDAFYTITQTDDESREVYLDRVNYIIERFKKNHNENEIINMEKIVELSYIWRNKYRYNMSYPNNVIKLL